MITKREFAFHFLLTEDHTRREIANQLYIRNETVKIYFKNVGAKLKVKTNGVLVYQPLHRGLIKCIYYIFVFNLINGSHANRLSAQSIGLQIESSQSVLFGDSMNGGGSKLIWDSDKAALRAGAVTGSSTVESYWDRDSIGNYSVSFGRNNNVRANYGMSWGEANESSGDYSTSWGDSNISSGSHSTSWGVVNASTGPNSTSWGVFNVSSGSNSTSWGLFNVSSGDYSTSWGESNSAQSIYETVIGRYADRLTHSNSSLWESDDQLFVVGNGTSVSALNNALTVMKSGEVKVDEQLTLQGYDSAFGVGDDDGVIYVAPDKSSSDLILVANDGVAIHIDELNGNDSFFDIFNGSGVRIFSLNEDGNLTITGTYSPSSDVNRKEEIVAIDEQTILDELKDLSISEWQFKGESIRHIGPMAQDFYAAFGLGQGETTISTVDADGIALAAIKALSVKNEELETQNRELISRIVEIEKLLQKLLNR